MASVKSARLLFALPPPPREAAAGISRVNQNQFGAMLRSGTVFRSPKGTGREKPREPFVGDPEAPRCFSLWATRSADGIDRLQWSQALPWFVKENRRAAPRHRYDGNNAWIQLEGSLVRQCQVLDLSPTGVRLTVTNAHNLSNTFTLILSKNSTGQPARVKWRRGTEVGAEFFTANSRSAARLTAGAPKTVKPRGGEGQKSESLMSTPSLQVQGQQPDVAQLEADPRNVAGSVGGDKAKTEAHCQITDLSERMDRSDQEKNSKERMNLSRLQKKLGPDHVALILALKDVDPESPQDGNSLQ